MKVIDCFPFFNELDLLEIRLNELRGVVDVFVVTESPKTFTGKDKPLYFQENRDRFKDFNIVHSIFDGATDCHPMEFERQQKQYNLDYAFDNVFEPGDIIMFSDCDEIPKPDIVAELVKQEWKSVGLILNLYYYYFDCRQVGGLQKWPSIVLTRPEERMVYDVTRKNKVDRIIRDAGYHFSYFGNIPHKLESWGHANELNKPPYNDQNYIDKCRTAGKDFLARKGRKGIQLEFVDDISYLPKYILNNIDKYGQYISRYHNHLLHK